MNAISGYAPIRFGWSTANPPKEAQYLRPITKADVSYALGFPTPTRQLVQEIAEKLIKTGDADSRFVVIPNSLELLHAERYVNTFQSFLVQEITKYVAEHHPTVMQLYDPYNRVGLLPQSDHTKDYEVVQQVREDHLKGYGRTREKNLLGKMRTFPSYKDPHFDLHTMPFISFRYGPYKNLIGGDPQYSDARQFAKDNNLRLDEVLSGGSPNIKADYKEQLLQHYSHTLKLDTSKMPIVFVNNIHGAGVMHGATPPTPQDPNKKARRPVHHIAALYYARPLQQPNPPITTTKP